MKRKFCHCQFSIQLCSAMTIEQRQSQGQPVAHVGLDLQNSVL
ncbi:MAG TPA: hypothetical protein VGC75_00965 [Candidatus Nitrosocosmicus sp.]